MNDAFDFDLLCIGSGPAGQHAAIQAAKLRKRAAIVEKRRIVGGICLHTGTIPSKTFRQAVLSFAGNTGGFGVGFIHETKVRPTAEQLLARVAGVVQREVEVLEDQLWRNDIKLIHGEASFIDSHTLLVTQEEGSHPVSAANILIAVGTRPTQPPGVGTDGDIILTSDDIVHLKRLPRRMAVVGGGIIGIEYASMFAALEVDVTLIDKRDRLLEFVDQEIVGELFHQLRKHDMTLRLGEAVERLEITEHPPRQAVIHLQSGKRIVSDMVLFSAGRTAASDRLNLRAAGFKDDKLVRLKVDGQFRTSVPHIFAAGDVIGFPSLASTSAEQGRLAARYAFGVEAEPMSDRLPIGIYAIPEISMVGSTEQELTAKKVPYETGVARYKEIARGQILGDDSGMLKMLFHREDKRLLGVHAIGTGATELIHIGQAILGTERGLDYFLQTVFNYPTLAECYKVAALNACNKLFQ